MEQDEEFQGFLTSHRLLQQIFRSEEEPLAELPTRQEEPEGSSSQKPIETKRMAEMIVGGGVLNLVDSKNSTIPLVFSEQFSAVEMVQLMKQVDPDGSKTWQIIDDQARDMQALMRSNDKLKDEVERLSSKPRDFQSSYVEVKHRVATLECESGVRPIQAPPLDLKRGEPLDLFTDSEINQMVDIIMKENYYLRDKLTRTNEKIIILEREKRIIQNKFEGIYEKLRKLEIENDFLHKELEVEGHSGAS